MGEETKETRLEVEVDLHSKEFKRIKALLNPKGFSLKINTITRWEVKRAWNKYYLEKETLNTSNPDSEKLLIYVWRNLDLE